MNGGIVLGNLSVRNIEERLGITLTDEERNSLSELREQTCDKVTKGRDVWHCYDIPFRVECGSEKVQRMFIDILKPHVKEFKTQIGIATLA